MKNSKWTLVASYGSTLRTPTERVIGHADNNAELLLAAQKAVEGRDDPWAMGAWDIVHRPQPLGKISLDCGSRKGFRIAAWNGGSVYAVLN